MIQITGTFTFHTTVQYLLLRLFGLFSYSPSVLSLSPTMSSDEACCTCATLLSSLPPSYDEKTEKPSPIHERRLECCGRAICSRCVTDNPRFATYCPFCQVSTAPSALPQGLRDPPPYEEGESRAANVTAGSHESNGDELPSYNSLDARPVVDDKTSRSNDEPAPDVLHFVNPDQDSIPTLAIRYGVPINALRRTNGLFSDNLLAARRTILIPGEFYKGGISLSPRPVEGEEEEIRKGKVRKWMVACKVAE